MSVRIRLARGGTKKRPFYRIVATNSREPRDGRFLEKLGTYNPILPGDSPERVVLREERLRYWLGVGAQPSDRVARFLDSAGITQNATRWRGTGKRAEAIAAQKAEAEAAGRSRGSGSRQCAGGRSSAAAPARGSRARSRGRARKPAAAAEAAGRAGGRRQADAAEASASAEQEPAGERDLTRSEPAKPAGDAS